MIKCELSTENENFRKLMYTTLGLLAFQYLKDFFDKAGIILKNVIFKNIRSTFGILR